MFTVDLDLREFDLLALARARAMKSRGQDRDQSVTRIGDVIGIVGSGAERRAAGTSSHRHQAAERRDGGAEPDIVAMRTAAPCIGIAR